MSKRRDSYTATEADNALCIYEWLMQVMITTGSAGRNDRIISLYSNHGWAAMRSATLQAALICEDVWQHAKGPDDWPEHFDQFDWDFVPAFCRVLDWDQLLDNNQHGDGVWRSDAPTIWAAMVATVALKPGRKMA
jgi:hypothetical protein